MEMLFCNFGNRLEYLRGTPLPPVEADLGPPPPSRTRSDQDVEVRRIASRDRLSASHGLVLADHVIPALRPVLFIQCCCHRCLLHRWPRSRMLMHRGSIFDCRLRFTPKRQPEYPRMLSTSGRIWTLYTCASALQVVSCKFIRCFSGVSCDRETRSRSSRHLEVSLYPRGGGAPSRPGQGRRECRRSSSCRRRTRR